MATTDFLVLDRASKAFPTPTGEYIVLDKVNLTVQQGEFICIIGHSGCGKSTLLNMVSGFSQPSSGQVLLNGNPIGKPGPAANIGEVLTIPFSRPRDRSRMMEMPEYYQLRNYALDFLYNRYAHDDE